MSKAWQPRTFRTGGIVDVEDVNDNLRALARDTKRNNDRRYTYCPVVIPLDGMINTDTEEARRIALIQPGSGTGYRFEVVGVELVVYAATGATWTLTSQAGTIAVVAAGAAVEAYGSSNVPVALTDTDPLVLTMAASAANTIVRGFIVVHLRVDRFVTAARSDYSPALLSAASSSAGSVLDTELTAAAVAVTGDLAAAEDIRCECFVLRRTAAAMTWRLPNGAGRTALKAECSIVANVGESVLFAATAGSVTVLGGGTTATNAGSFTQTSGVDDPTDFNDDTVVTLTPAGGTVELAYMFLWWS